MAPLVRISRPLALAPSGLTRYGLLASAPAQPILPLRDHANRARALSRAFSASASRLRGGLVVASAASSVRAASATSSTARSNAASFAFEGRLKPLSLRTNCSADARISSSVAGGSKLNSVRMLRHMGALLRDPLRSPDGALRNSAIREQRVCLTYDQ